MTGVQFCYIPPSCGGCPRRISLRADASPWHTFRYEPDRPSAFRSHCASLALLCGGECAAAFDLVPLSPCLSLALGSASLSLVPRARLKVSSFVRPILRRPFLRPSLTVVGGPHASEEDTPAHPAAPHRPALCRRHRPSASQPRRRRRPRLRSAARSYLRRLYRRPTDAGRVVTPLRRHERRARIDRRLLDALMPLPGKPGLRSGGGRSTSLARP